MTVHLDDNQTAVSAVFLAYFQRAPEFQAMQHYVGVLENHLSQISTATEALKLISAQIYADGVGALEIPAGPAISSAWYVTYLYRNILGREPEAAGLQYWMHGLESEAVAWAELAGVFLAAALGAGGRDAAYVQNRVAVAIEFAAWQNSNPQVLPFLPYNAAEVLLGVNDNMATVSAAQARLYGYQSQFGKDFWLTLGIDSLQGSNANDRFHAVYDGDQEISTLTSFDSLDGGLGHDALNIYLGENGAAYRFPDFAQIRNIEIIHLFNGAQTVAYHDLSHWDENNTHWLSHLGNYPDLQEFWQWYSTAPVLEVPADVIVGFRDVNDLWEDVFLQAGVKAAHIRLDNVSWQDHVAAQALEGLPWLYVQGDALEVLRLDGVLADEASWLMLDIRGGAGRGALKLEIGVNALLGLMPWERDGARISWVDAAASTGDLLLYADPHWLATAAQGLTLMLGEGDDRVVFDHRPLETLSAAGSSLDASLPPYELEFSSLLDEGDLSVLSYPGRELGLRDVLDGGTGWDVLQLWVQGQLQTQTYDAINRATNFEEISFLTQTAAMVDAAQLSGFAAIGLAGVGTEAFLAFTLSHMTGEQRLIVDMSNQQPLLSSNPTALISLTLEEAEQDLRLELRAADVQLSLGEAPGAEGGSLQVWGEGVLEFSNQAGKYLVIDSRELTGTLLLQGMSENVAETIWLPQAGVEQWASVTVALHGAGANSSTVGLTDTLLGFHDQVRLKVKVGPDKSFAQVHQASFKEQASLEDALAAAATQFAGSSGAAPLAAYDLIAFSLGNDAYLYGDTQGTGQGGYDAQDFLLKIVGLPSLDSLLAGAVEFI